jgi:hypothetical protein
MTPYMEAWSSQTRPRTMTPYMEAWKHKEERNVINKNKGDN